VSSGTQHLNSIITRAVCTCCIVYLSFDRRIERVYEDGGQATDSFRVELELVEVVEDGVFVGVEGAVVGESASERLVGVVRADDDHLRQVDDALSQELVARFQRHDQSRHYQPVVRLLAAGILLVLA